MKLNLLVGLASTLFALAPTSAHADSPFEGEPGIRLSLGITHMENTGPTDDFDPFDETNALIPHLGYRFAFGTELFGMAGVGNGGKEGSIHHGAGVRQHFRFDAVEPFVQLGLFQVGEFDGTPLSPSVGVGVNYWFGENVSLGLAAGHYFSSEEDSAMDWYYRAQVGFHYDVVGALLDD
jgi:hypothetical protein